MALTNQPYLPLYVDDWMNNNKLKMCSTSAHGVMISVMCILHKEATYGKILLKQRFKQSEKQIDNFALQIAKLSAFDFAEVKGPLSELLNETILVIEDDYLVCPRMVRDGEISEKRAAAGKNGATSKKEKAFAKANPKASKEANDVANTVNGIVIENECESNGKEGMGEKPKRRVKKQPEEKIEIIYPFNTENFKTQWKLWKAYKRKEHKFNYKSEESEQANLTELSNLSIIDGQPDEKKAIAIMNQSMAKGWKGFFELKTNENGKTNSNRASGTSFSVNR